MSRKQFLSAAILENFDLAFGHFPQLPGAACSLQMNVRPDGDRAAARFPLRHPTQLWREPPMAFRRIVTAFSLASLVAIGASPVAFAEGQLRIVEQFGTIYLPLHVLRDQ